MAAKPQKSETSALASAFLNIVDNRDIEIHEISGIGKVGIKRLSIGGRDAWMEREDNQQIYLLQQTVCDPETGELVLDKIDIERLKGLPVDVAEELGLLIFKQNGFKTSRDEGSESTELKNLEASQS